MSIFGGSDLASARKLEILGEQLDAREEKLNELEGVDMPESALQREDLKTQIEQINMNIADVKEQQAAQDMNQEQDQGFFTD